MRLSRRLAAAGLCAVLAISGCGSQDPSTEGNSDGVRLYGSDGNMSNTLGDAFEDYPGVLAGMKGTAPMTPLSDEFVRRLRTVQPKLVDFNYAGESYDAVIVAALATEVARTTVPQQIARYVTGVTSGDLDCTSYAECLVFVHAGKAIRYRGVSLRRGGFTDAGEPATATYGTLHFSGDNRLDAGKTEFVGAGNEADTSRAPRPAAPSPDQRPQGAPLVVGSLLPKSGQLANMYPPLIAGVQLAINDVNAAGGVLDKPVTFIEDDDGTSGDKAKAAVERLLTRKVHVIIGAGASGVSAAVIPRVTQAGVLMISPSATADELTGIPDNNLFFRTAPPDNLQAKALADVLMRDGAQRVFIVARDDSWGNGLANNIKANLQSSGVKPESIKVLTYTPGDSGTPDVSSMPQQVKDFGPDSLVILGFDESAHVIDELIQKGITLHH